MGNGNLGIAAQQAEQPKQGQISEELDRLDSTQINLAGAVDRLNTRLDVVLRPEPPATGSGKNAVDQVVCTLADHIRAQRRGFEESIERLNAIINRVEI